MMTRLRDYLTALQDRLPSAQHINERGGRWLAQKSFSTADRLTLYEDLAFLLDNNLKVENAVAAMINSFGGKRPPVFWCLRDILTALRQGKSVDQGLTLWIPLNEVTILHAGIQDGNLAAAFYRAISVVKGTAEMKSALISTLTYPLLLLATTFGMMKMITTYFLPRLEMIAGREKWEGALWWLGALSEFFIDNALFLSALALLLTAFVIWSLANLTGKARQHLLDRLLPWSVYRDVLGVGFLMNFSAMMRAQVKTEDALEVLSRHAGPWLYERLAAIQRQVKQGDHLGQALRYAGYGFPSPRAIDKLVLLTDGDNAENIIENFARMWLVQTVCRIRRLATLLSNLTMGINAGYMILIVLATQNLNALVNVT